MLPPLSHTPFTNLQAPHLPAHWSWTHWKVQLPEQTYPLLGFGFLGMAEISLLLAWRRTQVPSGAESLLS